MGQLLAVDTGLRTGLALFDGQGRLLWYHSQHFGNRSALRRGVRRLFAAHSEIVQLVLEGGGDIATVWQREAERLGLTVQIIGAETWRAGLGIAQGRRNRDDPKRGVEPMARRVIAWSGAPRPTSLRHDAAEAILIGLWAAAEAGWLDQPLTTILGC